MFIALFLIFSACPLLASQPAQELEIEMADVATALVLHEAPAGIIYMSKLFPKQVINVIDIKDVIVCRILRDTQRGIMREFKGMNGPNTNEILLNKEAARQLFYQLHAKYGLLEKTDREWLELAKQHGN